MEGIYEVSREMGSGAMIYIPRHTKVDWVAGIQRHADMQTAW
jgi:hypothetical protein